jgi:hypothetical protein
MEDMGESSLFDEMLKEPENFRPKERQDVIEKVKIFDFDCMENAYSPS